MSSTLSFKDLANAAIASYKGRDGSFASRLQFWMDLFGDRPVTEITPDDVDDGVGILTQRKKIRVLTTKAGVTRTETDKRLSGSTINRYVASLGTCFKDLRRMRLLPRGFVSPMRGIERQPEGEARDIGDVTHTDIRRLIACCRVSRNRKLAALVAFSATTGWRQGSVQALTWGAVDLKQGFADTRRTKNGSPHRCVLQPFVVDELRRIRPEPAADNELIFGKHNVGKAWLNALQRANLPADWTLHHLRHVAASILAQDGASVPVIMQALNHKTPAMALRYSHLDVQTLRQATASAWGAA
jgi:integrase